MERKPHDVGGGVSTDGRVLVACPVQFIDAEMDGFEQEQLWFDLNKAVEFWQEQVGVSEDGWVSNEGYEETVQRVAELKASRIAIAEDDKEDIRLLEVPRDREEIS